MTDPDLTFLGQRIERLTGDVAGLRDDMRVLTAIAMRTDGMIGALLEEVRAVHAQIGRMNDRLRKLEDAAS